MQCVWTRSDVTRRMRNRRFACNKMSFKHFYYPQRMRASENCSLLELKVAEKREELRQLRLQLIAQLRELIYKSDQTLKSCTSHYFKSMHELYVLRPLQYSTLADSTYSYCPGQEYASYIRGRGTIWLVIFLLMSEGSPTHVVFVCLIELLSG